MKLLTPQETLQAIVDGVKLEYKWSDNSEWKDFDPVCSSISIESIFKKFFVFRLRQEMITIGDVSFPKPESEPLEIGTEYWVAEPSYRNCISQNPYIWDDDDIDRRYLRRGLVHLTRENAIAHTKALIQLGGGKVDE